MIVETKDEVVVESVGALESGDLATGVKLGLGQSILEVGLGELGRGFGESEGPRRNLAWPVLFKREIRRLNLETVKSAISEQLGV